MSVNSVTNFKKIKIWSYSGQRVKNIEYEDNPRLSLDVCGKINKWSRNRNPIHLKKGISLKH